MVGTALDELLFRVNLNRGRDCVLLLSVLAGVGVVLLTFGEVNGGVHAGATSVGKNGNATVDSAGRGFLRFC